MRRGAGVNPEFARANARGQGGLQSAVGRGGGGAGLEARLARGRQSGTVDLTGLELQGVPDAVFAIFDAAPPAAASASQSAPSFDGDGGDKWWELESAHVAGGVAKLNLSQNSLTEIPAAGLAQLVGLRVLELAHNRLVRLPVGAFSALASLQLLDASHNALSEFCGPGIAALQALVKLDLSHNRGLARLGPEVGALRTSLAELDASGCQLAQLPAELCDCRGLRTLALSENRLQELPPHIGQLGRLEELEVSKALSFCCGSTNFLCM
eukprot:SAG22_NODE_2999_length_2037_cov_10.413313_1_plen_268_part_00